MDGPPGPSCRVVRENCELDTNDLQTHYLNFSAFPLALAPAKKLNYLSCMSQVRILVHLQIVTGLLYRSHALAVFGVECMRDGGMKFVTD